MMMPCAGVHRIPNAYCDIVPQRSGMHVAAISLMLIGAMLANQPHLVSAMLRTYSHYLCTVRNFSPIRASRTPMCRCSTNSFRGAPSGDTYIAGSRYAACVLPNRACWKGRCLAVPNPSRLLACQPCLFAAASIRYTKQPT